MMKRIRHHHIGLLLAVLMWIQAALPMVSLAQVTVRCVGSAMAGKPCAREIIPLAVNDGRVMNKCAEMSCCRNRASLMRACQSAMSMRLAPDSAVTTLRAPLCLITITPINGAQPAAVRSSHRWLLDAAPALAPPPAVSALVFDSSSVLFSPPVSSSPATRLFDAARGLRAPPAS